MLRTLLLGRRIGSLTAAGKSRMMSSGPKLVQVEKNEETGVSTISMARKPVNGLNLELLTDLNEALLASKKDGSSGVILTSSLATIFSGGLDIMEMYKPDEKRVVKFWTTLQDTWMTLYGLDIPTAAAINGASPAGGCLLAMSCEYRTMVDGKHTIGLNETRLGIAAPKWFITTMIDTIGNRQAELALLRGSLFTPQEALKISLIDDMAVDKEDALKKCNKYISDFEYIPGRARAVTKHVLRAEKIAWLKENREKDLAAFLRYLKEPMVQTGLDLYVQSLKQKSKI